MRVNKLVKKKFVKNLLKNYVCDRLLADVPYVFHIWENGKGFLFEFASFFFYLLLAEK